MESRTAPQINEQVRIERLLKRKVMLVRLQGLINDARLIDFLIDRPNQLEETIVGRSIHIIDGSDDEAESIAALKNLA